MEQFEKIEDSYGNHLRVTGPFSGLGCINLSEYGRHDRGSIVGHRYRHVPRRHVMEPPIRYTTAFRLPFKSDAIGDVFEEPEQRSKRADLVRGASIFDSLVEQLRELGLIECFNERANPSHSDVYPRTSLSAIASRANCSSMPGVGDVPDISARWLVMTPRRRTASSSCMRVARWKICAVMKSMNTYSHGSTFHQRTAQGAAKSRKRLVGVDHRRIRGDRVGCTPVRVCSAVFSRL